jgi:hypothetical protein
LQFEIQQAIFILATISQILVLFMIATFAKGNLLKKLLVGISLSTFGMAIVIQTALFMNINLNLISLSVVIVTCFYFGSNSNEVIEFIKKFFNALRKNLGSSSIISVIIFYLYMYSAISKMSNIDGLLYHGPLLANISQNRFWNLQLINQYSYYPNIGINSSLNLIKSTGSVIFDDSVSIPFFLIIIISLVSIIKHFTNLSLFSTTLLSCLVVSSPVLWMQNKVLGSDLAMAAGVISFIALFVLKREMNKFEFICSATIIGFIVGARPNGMIYGIIFFMLIIIKYRTESKRIKYELILWNSIGLLLGGLGILRNIILFKNPFYPASFSIMGYQLNGPLDIGIYKDYNGQEYSFVDLRRIWDFFRSITYGTLNGLEKMDYDPRETGFSRVVLQVLILALLLILINTVKNIVKVRDKRNGIEQKKVAGVILILIGFAFILLVFQKNSSDSRYTISAYLILCLSIIILLLNTIRLDKMSELIILIILMQNIIFNERNIYPQGFTEMPTKINSGNLTSGYEWLDQSDDCKKIAIQTSGGLAEYGIQETATLNILYYPYFGNKLCNQIFAFTKTNYDIYGNKISKQDWEDIIKTTDYIVTYAKYDDEILKELNKIDSRLMYKKASTIDPVLDSWLVRPDGQIVWQILHKN